MEYPDDVIRAVADRALSGLRQTDGIDLADSVFAAYALETREAADEAVRRGWAVLEKTRLRPTAVGLRHADGLAELFF